MPDGSESLVVIGHGALLCGAGQVLREHQERLRGRGFLDVELAFLNYNRPSLLETLAQVAAAGRGRVVLLPYFLVPGRFVAVELPRQVAAALGEVHGLDVVTAEPIGYHPQLSRAVEDLAALDRGPADWRADLRLALRDCERRSECPLYAEPVCACPAPEPVASPEPDPGGKTALLLMAHGSPRAQANEPIVRIAEDLRGRGAYDSVSAAYLERNEPDIAAALERSAQQGARNVIAVPLFLHAGGHVAEDLPLLLEAAQRQHPDISYRMTPLLGSSPRVSEVLYERAVHASATARPAAS